MHTFGETGAGVPAFLAKLWRLVDDPDTNNLIFWSKDGRSFIIQNQAQFAHELLPLNYKHNNMASFIRQLNMYGFHKITSIDNGGLKFDRDEMEFSHPCFKRNCPYLLEHIKRKIANPKTSEEKLALKPEAVTRVLQDVKAMRGRQDSLDSRFSVMKQENEALWREIATLRQKHAKQQQIVNKLIQFLITIVQPSRNMSGVKRHMQLMINDTPENLNFRKASESESECGPVIHELGEELLDEVADVDDSDLMDPISPYARSTVTHIDTESPSPSNVERPQSRFSASSHNQEYSNQSIEDVLGSGQGNAVENNANQRNRSPNLNAAQSASLVQTVNPDGSKIVYHVTEVPDAHPNEGGGGGDMPMVTIPAAYIEENELATPMVRAQMARSQLLKQKNKQRRQQADNMQATMQQRLAVPKVMHLEQQQQQSLQQQNNKMANVKTEGKLDPLAFLNSQGLSTQQQQQQQQLQQPLQQQNDKVAVKIEAKFDPMIFLNSYNDNSNIAPDPRLISPNYSEDSAQAAPANVNIANAPSTQQQTAGTTADDTGMTGIVNSDTRTSSNMYSPSEFLANNMPNDLFDDSSILSATGDNSNYSENMKLKEQQQYGRTTAKSGTFSTYIAGNNAGNELNSKDAVANRASTSTATGANTPTASTTYSMAAGPVPSTSAAAAAGTLSGKGKSPSNMAVTKYKTEDGGHDVMRLSSPEEVNGHLDNVQDELETLRDLLRGDGYSLDANTLMSLLNGSATDNNNAMDMELLNKLFNESDILGPYGISIEQGLPVNSNEKKGSELMAYQPVYDLSDILDKSDLEGDTDSLNGPSSSQQLSPSQRNQNTSVLNTPYHE